MKLRQSTTGAPLFPHRLLAQTRAALRRKLYTVVESYSRKLILRHAGHEKRVLGLSASPRHMLNVLLRISCMSKLSTRGCIRQVPRSGAASCHGCLPEALWDCVKAAESEDKMHRPVSVVPLSIYLSTYLSILMYVCVCVQSHVRSMQ